MEQKVPRRKTDQEVFGNKWQSNKQIQLLQNVQTKKNTQIM